MSPPGSSRKSTVLITGCSDGGLGSALAMAFHERGLRVLATARNPSKMASVKAKGIECLTLDVLSDTSIKACVEEVIEMTGGSLDILLNNAGGGYQMPVSDLDLNRLRDLFDLNVFSYITVTNAFLPLIIKSRGKIINNTSLASLLAVPWNGAYSASKAAIAMLTETQRVELQPFGIKVIDLKTGSVKSNIFSKLDISLPPNSINLPAEDKIKEVMAATDAYENSPDADTWAKEVVGDVLKSSPPHWVWRGSHVWLAWLCSMIPTGWMDGKVKQMRGVDVLEQKVKEQNRPDGRSVG